MKPRKIYRHLQIEELEPRIAPTGIWDYWQEIGAHSATDGGISVNSGDSTFPAVAVGTDGNPIAIWKDATSGNREIYVRRWDGSSWVEMGAGSASGGGISNGYCAPGSPRIAIGADGNPVVAWATDPDRDNWGDEIYVRRWDGSSWVEMGGSASGGGISNNPGRSSGPAVAIGADGNPIVTWDDWTGGGSCQVYVRRWSGSAWVEMGSGSASGNGISQGLYESCEPEIAICAGGSPMVVWQAGSGSPAQIYGRMWNGASWVELAASGSGGGISNDSTQSFHSAIAAGTDGNPIVTWQDSRYNEDVGRIYVKRWNGSAWVEVGAGSASGNGISGPGSYAPCITSGSDGNPIVAWQDNSVGNWEIYVRRWNGSSWAEMGAGSATGGGVSSNAGTSECPQLAKGGDGNPIVAWQDTSSGNGEIHVRRYVEGAALPTVTIGTLDATRTEDSGGGELGIFPGSALSDAYNALVARGGTVSTTSTITPDFLDTVNAFYFPLCDVNVSDAEVLALNNWVFAGGRMLIQQDMDHPNFHWFPISNRVLNEFGLSAGGYDGTVLRENEILDVAHPLAVGVDSYSTFGCSSLSSPNPSFHPIGQIPPGPFVTLAVLPYGQGEVAASSDVNMWYGTGWNDNPGNHILWDNMLTWLGASGHSGAPTGLDLLPISDTGVSDSDNITNLDNSAPSKTLQFTVFGTIAGAVVNMYSDSGALIGTATASGTTTTIITNGTADLADDARSITARQTEPGKTESAASPALSMTIDTTAPTASAPDLNAASDTGISNSDNITQGNNPVFAGTAGDTMGAYKSGIWKVEVKSDDGKTGTDSVSPFYSASLATLNEGTRTVSAVVYDIAGNTASTGSLTVYVDRTAPTASAPDLNAGSDTGVSSTDNITQGNNPVFDGTAGDTMGAYKSGIWKVDVKSDDGKIGTDSVSPFYSASLPTLTEGPRSVWALVYDVAGNTFSTASLAVTVDRTAPAPPNAPDLDAASDSGMSDMDNITNVSTPVIYVAAQYYRLFRDGVPINDDPYLPPVGPLPPQPEGVHGYAVKAWDVAGNESALSSAVDITFDYTPPTGSVPDLDDESDTGLSNSDNITNADLLMFTGTASDERSGVWKVLVASDDGKFDVVESAPFYTATLAAVAEGQRTVNATVYDVAGNISVTGALSVTVDRTAPDVPNAPDLDDASDTGFSNTDNITNDTTPTLNLSGYESYYRLYRNGAQISGDYASATPFTEDPALAKGMYAYALEAVDAAGNLSAPSDDLLVTIAEEIILHRGQPVFFTDGDGSSVIVHLSDCGQAIGFMTLTNGETTGAAISLIYLKDTTGNSSLEIHSIDGSVPGTSFEGLVIDNAEGTTEALNMLLAPAVNLAPGGFILADGSIRSITLASVGEGSLIYAEGINSLNVQGSIGGAGALTTIYAGAAGVGSMRSGGMTNTLLNGGAFGNVAVLGNLTDSLLLSGYDIGGDVILGTDDDGAFSGGTGNIGTITINGNLVGTTIIAGIDPGPDGIFGTADDGVVSSSSIEGAIKALIVKGGISGPTTVLANSTIGSVKVGNTKLSLPYMFGNILIAQNWK